MSLSVNPMPALVTQAVTDKREGFYAAHYDARSHETSGKAILAAQAAQRNLPPDAKEKALASLTGRVLSGKDDDGAAEVARQMVLCAMKPRP